MSPALVVGTVAAALTAALYAASRRFDHEHRVLRVLCYTAVAALIPPAVFTIIEFDHLDRLLLLGIGLAAALGLLFFATRGDSLPWAITFGMGGLRVWVVIFLASAAGYGLVLRY